MFASKDLFFTRPSGYQISRSVRLRSSASAYLNRTISTPTSAIKWTWSGWVKRGTLGVNQTLFGSTAALSSNFGQLNFDATDHLAYTDYTTSIVGQRVTNAVYRDPSAWYHIVLIYDSGNATAGNRILLYVNGVQVTSFSASTDPSLNSTSFWNNTSYNPMNIGRLVFSSAGANYFDGYLTEINFIDGQSLTPSSFGSTNANGVWSPIKYAGTYGTNGFYLNFSDNSGVTATTIGKDNSGNGNNWTPNNISVTAGGTYDSMIDVPTLYADGGNGRGNYPTLNPLAAPVPASSYVSSGNLTVYYANTSLWISVGATIAVSSGKYYWEITTSNIASPSDAMIGIASINDVNTFITTNYYTGQGANNYGYYSTNGNKYNNATGVAYGTGWGNVLIGVALDMNAGTLTYYVNNTSQGVAFTGLSGTFTPTVSSKSGVLECNFGQRPFTYTPPTGFVALNTQNLSTPTIANGAAYMAATTYTGNGTSLSVSNAVNSVSFQPDFIWIKDRSNARSNVLQNSVTGAAQYLISDATSAEATSSSGVTAINSNGFTVGTQLTWNGSAETYVGWQWKAGTTSASNTNGTITSTVSVGATQGFSLVTYTGTGANATVGHGLGVAPSMMIIKNRGGVVNWGIYHKSLGSGSPQTYVLQFDTSAQFGPSATYWNSTAPTSSVFSLGTLANTNGSGGNFVAYCFSEVAGFSKFGSYTGNGSADGPFVYLGFRPRFVMTKLSSAAGAGWWIYDTARDPYNATNDLLQANLANASASSLPFDILSNGFKIRTADVGANTNGATYIYACFAENPLKYALAR